VDISMELVLSRVAPNGAPPNGATPYGVAPRHMEKEWRGATPFGVYVISCRLIISTTTVLHKQDSTRTVTDIKYSNKIINMYNLYFTVFSNNC